MSFDFRAALADDHAGLGAVDEDADFRRISFDADIGDAGGEQGLLEVVPDLLVFHKDIAEQVILGEPLGVPVLNHAHPETVGIHFLAHTLPPHSFSLSTIVMWEVRLAMR